MGFSLGMPVDHEGSHCPSGTVDPVVKLTEDPGPGMPRKDHQPYIFTLLIDPDEVPWGLPFQDGFVKIPQAGRQALLVLFDHLLQEVLRLPGHVIDGEDLIVVIQPDIAIPEDDPPPADPLPVLALDRAVGDLRKQLLIKNLLEPAKAFPPGSDRLDRVGPVQGIVDDGHDLAPIPGSHTLDEIRELIAIHPIARPIGKQGTARNFVQQAPFSDAQS